MRGVFKLTRTRGAIAAAVTAWLLLYLREILQVPMPLYPSLVLVALCGYLSLTAHKLIRFFLVLVAVCVVGASITSQRARINPGAVEKSWISREAKLIVSTLKTAGERVKSLENLSTDIGGQTVKFVQNSSNFTGEDSLSVRINEFDFLEKLAEQAKHSKALPEGTAVGIQLLGRGGERVAWAGWPQALSQLDRELAASGRELVYSRQVSLYRILTHVLPLENEGVGGIASVVVDIPLEANYKVNNKFIKGTSLTSDVDSRLAGNISLEYYPAAEELAARRREVAGQQPAPSASSLSPRQSAFPSYMEQLSEVQGDMASGLGARAMVKSNLNTPLLNVSVQGRPFRHFIAQREAPFLRMAKALIIAAFLLLFILGFIHFPRRLTARTAVLKGLLLVAFITAFRYSLLSLQIVEPGGGFKIFDPVIFATPLLWGLMRSAGDMLISALAFVIAVYGLLKIARSVESGSSGRESAKIPWLFILKAIAATAVVLVFFGLSHRFINTVVVNANPRLIGETVNLFASEVVVLHLGVFLMMTGFSLAAIMIIWGIMRLGGQGDSARTALVAAALASVAAGWLWGWVFSVVSLLLLLFIFFAPRFIHREDLVSIVISSFYLVIIVSGVSYICFNEDYLNLRKVFVQEKAAELANPADNWKAFILEDILDNVAKNNMVRKVLRNPEFEGTRSLSFDLWAESSLSLLGYSSAIYVLDRGDSVISRFAVDMPFRADFSRGDERINTASNKHKAVLTLTKDTGIGTVRYYRGIVNIEEFMEEKQGQVEKLSLGKIIIDVPFFFENLSWASRTGPRTPEILRNIQEGGIEPRLEKPEALLLARLRGGLVLESSSDDLPAGAWIPPAKIQKARGDEWPLLSIRGETYRFMIGDTQKPNVSLLAGFATLTPFEHGLRWSTLLSLYLLFTFAMLVAIVALKQIPLFKEMLPTLLPGRRLEFQQKLLASFLVVALVPAIILGIFSVQMIKGRFIQESKKEALAKALSTKKTLVNTLHQEFEIFASAVDIESLTKESVGLRFGAELGRLIATHKEESGANPYSQEELFIMRDGTDVFIGVFSRTFTFEEDGYPKDYTFYYGRKLDSAFLGEISDEVGADVNIYLKGELVASSREGLMASGLMSSVMNDNAFVKVSLLGVDHALSTESAGRYEYQVAYLPLAVAGMQQKAALSLPLLFRPESYSLEVQKSTSAVFGIFALLFAATIGLGLLLARGIFEPLKDLLEGTRRIARGELSFKLPQKRRDEIGTVIAAFNEMTSQLASSQTALEERRRYLEAILANIGTGVISTDAQEKIITLNNAAEEILGVSAGQSLGKTPGQLAAGNVMSEFFSALEKSAYSREPFISSEISVAKGGRRCTIKYMHTKLNFDNRYFGAVYVFEDLTELINSKKLSAWVEMARQIAHEIKNPLTPIKLSTQFMQKAYEHQSPEFGRIFRESSETIIQQVDVLKRIAGEFSSFGKMQQLHVETRKLAPLINNIVTPYRRSASGIEVSLDIASPDIEVLIDVEALRRICGNLIENAIEAMPDGGKLRIEAEEVVEDDGKYARITFTDTGPGLSEVVKEKLFEPYFSTKTTGTGLGLAICQSLSQEMGGRVTVENLPGRKGAVATLLLRMEES